MKSRYYLCGPMRGVPAFNFPRFNRATDLLRQLGHEVFNPAERDLAIGFDPTDMDGFEDLAAHGFSLRDALGSDTAWICREADAVVVLDGWEGSSGARAEVALARALGLPVYPWMSVVAGSPVDISAPTRLPDVVPQPAPEVEERVTSATGGSKGRKLAEMGAIDPVARTELARVAGFGGRKYERGNYLKGYDWSLCIDALHRHLAAFESGEDRDTESGFLHAAHVAWHGLALCSFVLREIGTDDRFPATGAAL